MGKMPLTIAEDLVLLALEDRKGTLSWRASGFFEYALAGALLAELYGRGLLEVRGDGTLAVAPSKNDSSLSPLLAGILEEVRRHEPIRAAAWVSLLAASPELLHRQAEELVQKSVLERHEGRVLFLFHRKTYPMQDATPEKELVARLRAWFKGGTPLDAHDAAVLRLAHEADVLAPYFPAKDIADRHLAIHALAADNPVVAATIAAIAEARQVAFIAGTGPM